MKTFSIITLSILFACNSSKNKSEFPDLQYFNLNGNVKSFAEVKLNLTCNEEYNFNSLDNIQANYHQFNFDESGMLTTISNINPSPYAVTEPKIENEKNKLKIIQISPNENYTQIFSTNKDSLFISRYNKIDDNTLDYHTEKYAQKIYLKKDKKYILIQEKNGTNEKNSYVTERYHVETNEKGLESTLYVIDHKNDTIPYYKIKYIKFDKQGNWLSRQFQDLTEKTYNKCFNEYRKITYYK